MVAGKWIFICKTVIGRFLPHTTLKTTSKWIIVLNKNENYTSKKTGVNLQDVRLGNGF
jgi:hypothetical protein